MLRWLLIVAGPLVVVVVTLTKRGGAWAWNHELSRAFVQGIARRSFFLCPFEKDQKEMSFLLAQKKELKKTSTLTTPLPIWRGCKLRFAEPTNLRMFWYRGTTRWVFMFDVRWMMEEIKNVRR